MKKIAKTVYKWTIISLFNVAILSSSVLLIYNLYLPGDFIWFLLGLVLISGVTSLVSALCVATFLRYYHLLAQKLIGITHTLSRYRELKETLQFILTVMPDLLKCERVILFLLDKEKEKIIGYITAGFEIKEIRLPLWVGIIGDVIRTGKSINVKNVHKDKRFSPEIDEQIKFKTRNLLCLPMYNHAGDIFGAIEVLNKHKGHFTEMDEFLLSLLTEQIQTTIESAKLYEEREKFLRGAIKAFSMAIDARDPATRGHSERVTKYALAIGKALGLEKDELTTLEYAAMLHDIGKIGIRDDILLKPAEFTPEEYDIVKKHALYTKEILNAISFPETLKDIPMIAATHHEKINGSGYPFALKGESLSLLSKILAVADVYDALVSYDRPYKPPYSTEKALRELLQQAENGQQDKDIVKLFIDKKLYQIEKREFVRVNAEFAVEYRILSPSEVNEHPLLTAHSRDISLKGIQILASDYVPVASCLEMRIYITPHIISCFGKVVYISKFDEKYRIGVCFIGLNESDKELLKKYIIDLLM